MADLLGSLIADWLWWRMRSVTNAEAEFSTSTIASDVQGLTVEKLQEAMRSLPEVPPPPKVDLWPHDLGAGAYEMARGIVDSIPDLRGPALWAFWAAEDRQYRNERMREARRCLADGCPCAARIAVGQAREWNRELVKHARYARAAA